MARVLFYTGACMLALSAALLYLPTYFSFILAVIILLALIILTIFHKKIVINGLKTLLVFLLIFIIIGLLTYSTKIRPAENIAGYDGEIVGTVYEHPSVYETYTVYFIETENITLNDENGNPLPISAPQNLKLRLSDVNKIGAEIFDKLHLQVQFNDLDIYKSSFYANEIYAGGYIKNLYENLGKNRPFYAVFYDLREKINDLIYDNLYFDDAAVVSAVLIGDRSNLSSDFVSDSKAAGTTHMLVVSGMHLGILFQIFSRIFTALKIKRGKFGILMLCLIFAITAICGFTPSILRASLTYVIIVIGILIFKKPDSLNSLGTATIILLFSNPLGFGNLALLLSLLSTFGLLFICPILENAFTSSISKYFAPGKFIRTIIFSLSQTVSAILATLPVSIIYLGYISLISPIANLLTGYATSLLTAISFFAVAILFLPSVLSLGATFPLFAISLLVRYIVKITDICANVSFASIPARLEYLISFAIFALAIPFLIWAKKTQAKEKLRIAFKLCSSALVLISVSSALLFYNISPKNEIAVLNVGKGASILIKTETEVLSVGAGDALTDYNKIQSHMLKSCAQKIDHIIIPTANKSFAAGSLEMILQNKDAKIIYPKNGDYSQKLDYISNENFKNFEYKISYKTPSAEIITYADIGTVINFKNLSAIIYVGQGDLNKLFNEAKFERPILICANGLNQSIKNEISDLILCGAIENEEELTKKLTLQNIDYKIANKKTVSIEF